MEIPIPSLTILDDNNSNLIPPDLDLSDSNPNESNGINNPSIVTNPFEIYPGTFHIISIPFHHNPISIYSFFDNDNDYHYQSISIHHTYFLLITCIFIFCI